MRLLWVELRDFRNHEATRLEVADGLVVVVGGNGEGKTNLLEGMYYLLTLSCPRGGGDLPLVRSGTPAAYLRGEVETRGGRVLVEVAVRTAGANEVHVNRSPVRRRRDLRRQLRGVFFGPEDLGVVYGAPEARREFLDQAVVGLWPAKETALRSYDRALRQRNRLLKEWEGRGAPPGLEVWDGEVAEAGSEVIGARAEAVARLAGPAREEFRGLAGADLVVGYRPSVWGEPLVEVFLDRLGARREEELARRATLVGPHRDDLDLAVGGLAARGFASHGEAWGAALALRLGLAAAVEEEWGEPPVALLDDPFAALDPERRARLAGRLAGRGQVVVSAADAGDVPPGASAIWEVRGGRVEPGGPAP